MKGYIVGYISSWADDIVPVVSGYFSGWQKAIDVGKALELDNITRRNSFRKIFIIELEINKRYTIHNPNKWYENYVHHKFETVANHTILKCHSGKEIEIGNLVEIRNYNRSLKN